MISLIEFCSPASLSGGKRSFAIRSRAPRVLTSFRFGGRARGEESDLLAKLVHL